MRTLCRFALVAATLASLPAATEPWYAPLLSYQGTWKVKQNQQATSDVLVNQCATLGKFFACGQSVNGTSGGLVVFIPAAKPGHFFTQTIMPEGRATGRDELQIEGNSWTYTSRRDEGGKTTFFRTTNVFTDRNHIHFEQAESTDGSQWKVKNAGDEERAKPSRSR